MNLFLKSLALSLNYIAQGLTKLLSQEKLVERNTYVSNFIYSHLPNNYEGWNKREGGAKVAKLLNVELGINVEAGLF